MNTNNVIKLKRKRIKKINPLWIIAGLLAAILVAVLVILVRGGAEGIARDRAASRLMLIIMLLLSAKKRLSQAKHLILRIILRRKAHGSNPIQK